MLFGNVTLGKERSNEELEKQLVEKNQLIKTLNEKLSILSLDYKNLRKAHMGVLKHKSVHYFKKGKCFYVISNTQELHSNTKVKIGISTDINTRLKNHRTAMPYLKVHYIVFLNKFDLLERIMKEHFTENLDSNNHEFISGVSVKNIIKKVKECIQFIKCPYTQETNVELQKYNVDTNTEEVNDLIIENEINEIVKDVEEVEVEIEQEIVDKYIKRCAGKFHKTEEDRMLDSSMFHKNRACKDGIATYCKECTSKARYTDKNTIERKTLDYDREKFKFCPGTTHKTPEERVISLNDFHNNKATLDGKSTYCKECTGTRKYGEKRRKITTVYKKASENINTDVDKWCSCCENILKHNKFHANNRSIDGLQGSCKKCKVIKRQKK
jgi:hypothetical protein